MVWTSPGSLHSEKFTDNSAPPPWPPVSEQMVKTKPRQERKRHGVSWKEFRGEDIPKKSTARAQLSPHCIISRSLWELSGVLSYFILLPGLGIKPRASPTPGKCSTTELQTQSLFFSSLSDTISLYSEAWINRCVSQTLFLPELCPSIPYLFLILGRGLSLKWRQGGGGKYTNQALL